MANMACRQTPTQASPAPTSIAIMVLGKRTLQTTTRFVSAASPIPNKIRNTSCTDRVYLPIHRAPNSVAANRITRKIKIP